MKQALFITKTLLFITILVFTSCYKEGVGGKSSVSGYVQHHSLKISNAVVYIKYGATEFPGFDVSAYDASTTCDANAYFEIKDLRKGDYYLYSKGYDNSIMSEVTGGIGIKLKYNKSIATNVPVTE